MKTIILSLIIITNIFSQQWINQNPEFSEWNVNDILFVNETTGFLAIGPELYKTTDGAANLSMIYANPEYKGLVALFYFNDLLLVIAQNKILKSTDLGSSFSSISLPFSANRTCFVNANTGWIKTGNTIMQRTTDGGLTWTINYLPGWFSSFTFIDSLTGFAVPTSQEDSSKVFKTTNGGTSWTHLNTGINIRWGGVSFFDNGTGYITSVFQLDKFLYTSNRGEDWIIKDYSFTGNISVPVSLTKGPFGYSRFGDIPYSGGYVYITTDYGNTWQVHSTENPTTIFEFINSSTLIAGAGHGQVFKSVDSGENWDCITTPIINLFHGFFLNENYGWLSGDELMRTSDGGINWELIYIEELHMRKMFFLNENEGFGTYQDALMKTADGGITWDTLQILPPGQFAIQKIYFKDSINGYIIGRNHFMRTTDGGNSWNANNPDSISGLEIHFPTPSTGYIVGPGKGYKTTDGGINWILLTSLAGDEIFFIDNLTGWKGDGYVLSKTTDGGLSFFQLINHGQDDKFPEIKFFNHNEGVIHFYGHESIISTTDGGFTWVTIFHYNTYNVPWDFKTFFVAKNRLWVFSWDGIIYKYTDEVVPVELISLKAVSEENNIKLLWETATEKNNKGFEVERTSTDDLWTVIGYVQGKGTSIVRENYTFTDLNPEPRRYKYRLKQIDYDGTGNYSNEVEIDLSVPVHFALYQNYPNPFNPVTTIVFSIPENSNVSLKIYDILGNESALLLNEAKAPGVYEILWDASSYASGVYFYKLETENFISTKKLLLMK